MVEVGEKQIEILARGIEITEVKNFISCHQQEFINYLKQRSKSPCQTGIELKPDNENLVHDGCKERCQSPCKGL